MPEIQRASDFDALCGQMQSVARNGMLDYNQAMQLHYQGAPLQALSGASEALGAARVGELIPVDRVISFVVNSSAFGKADSPALVSPQAAPAAAGSVDFQQISAYARALIMLLLATLEQRQGIQDARDSSLHALSAKLMQQIEQGEKEAAAQRATAILIAVLSIVTDGISLATSFAGLRSMARGAGAPRAPVEEGQARQPGPVSVGAEEWKQYFNSHKLSLAVKVLSKSLSTTKYFKKLDLKEMAKNEAAQVAPDSPQTLGQTAGRLAQIVGAAQEIILQFIERGLNPHTRVQV